MVKRHGLVEVTRKRILTWASEDSSDIVLLSSVPYKHLRTFNDITDKKCLLVVVYVETNVLLFLHPYPHLYGLKQPRKRGLSIDSIMPHSAHELVKQFFLKEGAVF